MSPDGAFTVEWLISMGGGAVGFASDVVCLHQTSEQLRMEVSNCVCTGPGNDKLMLQWLSDRELQITYPSNMIVSRMLDKWRDVKIRYVRASLGPDSID